MIVKTTILFMLAYTVSGQNDSIEDHGYLARIWEKTFNFEITKLHLTSGLVEHFKYWRKGNISRLDVNNGAVTKISEVDNGEYGIRYQIRPETTDEEANQRFCYLINGTSDAPVEHEQDFLPSDVKGFKVVGKDLVKGVKCAKCERSYEDEESRTKEEFWAFADRSTKPISIIPVRYEIQTSNKRHGYIKSHVIYDYFNVHRKVKQEVFEVFNNYDCDVNDDEDGHKTTLDNDHPKSMKYEEIKELDEAFNAYKRQFNKNYAHQAEHEMRRRIFHKNYRLITDTNNQNLSYKLALNKMSDRTERELKRHRGLRRKNVETVGSVRFLYSEEEIKKISETLPAEYDLRLEGVVGPILDQDNCGSCWSFSATAIVEGALARSNGGKLITLSNQALLDCSWGMDNFGCDGGHNEGSYKWVMKYGLPTVEEYGPYVNSEGYCNIENTTTTYKIRGWTKVTPFSEEALKIAIINHGPVSVAVQVSDAFEHYDGGIFYDYKCGSDYLDHEVTLVGYGQKDGDTFWILKNSWGPYWGINGYMYISTRNNNCGVMTEPTYVVIK